MFAYQTGTFADQVPAMLAWDERSRAEAAEFGITTGILPFPALPAGFSQGEEGEDDATPSVTIDAPRFVIVGRSPAGRGEPAAVAAPAAKVDESRASHALAGRLVCLLTAASILSTLIWIAV